MARREGRDGNSIEEARKFSTKIEGIVAKARD